jgi:excisionase family DNA binding protein
MLAHPTYLSVPEAAVLLNVSETSVRRWVKSGRLRAITLPSGRRKVHRAEVDVILRGEYVAA